MRTLLLSTSLSLVLLSASAFGADAPAAAAPATPAAVTAAAPDYVVAKVNGQEIKKTEVDQLLATAFPGEDKPDFATLEPGLQENVVQNIALERMILAEAQKENFENDPALQQRLAFMRRQMIMKTFLEHKAKASVSEDALRAAYAEKVKGQAGKEEVRARHILVGTEAEAKQVIARLKKGEAFEKLAKEMSKDKARDNGGDLGYFTKDGMFPQLAETAFALKKDEISKPVKTDFGWHVVQVTDRRKASPPSFEQMKASLELELRDKAEQAYVEKTMQSAQVQLFDKDGKPVSAAKAMPAAGGTAKPEMTPIPEKAQ